MMKAQASASSPASPPTVAPSDSASARASPSRAASSTSGSAPAVASSAAVPGESDAATSASVGPCSVSGSAPPAGSGGPRATGAAPRVPAVASSVSAPVGAMTAAKLGTASRTNGASARPTAPAPSTITRRSRKISLKGSMMPSSTPWSRPKAKPAMNSSPPPPARLAILSLTAMRVSSTSSSAPRRWRRKPRAPALTIAAIGPSARNSAGIASTKAISRSRTNVMTGRLELVGAQQPDRGGEDDRQQAGADGHHREADQEVEDRPEDRHERVEHRLQRGAKPFELRVRPGAEPLELRRGALQVRGHRREAADPTEGAEHPGQRRAQSGHQPGKPGGRSRERAGHPAHRADDPRQDVLAKHLLGTHEDVLAVPVVPEPGDLLPERWDDLGEYDDRAERGEEHQDAAGHHQRRADRLDRGEEVGPGRGRLLAERGAHVRSAVPGEVEGLHQPVPRLLCDRAQRGAELPDLGSRGR